MNIPVRDERDAIGGHDVTNRPAETGLEWAERNGLLPLDADQEVASGRFGTAARFFALSVLLSLITAVLLLMWIFD